MTRSLKKGPYINEKLLNKVTKMRDEGVRKPIKTWARSSQISPEMVGFTFEVHNGKQHLPVFVVEGMVGHRFGEFSPTRTFRKHSSKKAK
ncbi:MAG: 30S ribosomal protein S19 [Patescibacteria group bacterium]